MRRLLLGLLLCAPVALAWAGTAVAARPAAKDRAVERARQTLGALVATSRPAPGLDPSWVRTGSRVDAGGTRTPVVVPLDARRGVRVQAAAFGLQLSLRGARRVHGSLVAGGDALVFPRARRATDLVVRPSAAGFIAGVVHAARAAPRSTTWRLRLLRGQVLAQVDRRTVALVGPAEPVGAPLPEPTAQRLATLTPAVQDVPVKLGDRVLTPDTLPAGAPRPAAAGELHRAAAQDALAVGQLAGLQRRLQGRVLAVFTAAAARDARHRAVRTTLTARSGTITLAVSARRGARFPVAAALTVAARPRATTPLGGAVELRHAGDRAYLAAINAYDSVTFENAMKMWTPGDGGLQPEDPQRFAFEEADRAVDWALAGGREVRGHSLVNADNVPPWIRGMGSGEVRAHLQKYVTTVVRHFAGRVRIWDVVNEPLDPDGKLKVGCQFRDRLYASFWGCHVHGAAGQDGTYIDDTLRWAREADPSARLVINEYGTEFESAAKHRGLVELLRRLQERGVPLDGVGFQMHESQNLLKFVPSERFTPAFQAVADLGLDVEVTEADVEVFPRNGGQARHDAHAQDEIFTRAAAACRAVVRCVRFTTWGIGDRWSWLNTQHPDGTQTPDALPLLLDGGFAAKAVFEHVVAALAAPR